MIHQTIDRVRVVLTAAVTYISAAILVLQYVLTQDVIADIPDAAQYIGQGITFLGGVIAIIRRVTPVPTDERGLLP